MSVIYDDRTVPAHFKEKPDIMLFNEAPGPQEAKTGFPLYGQQGGILYRTLLRNNVKWVKNWLKDHKDFKKWRAKILKEYANQSKAIKNDIELKLSFLNERAKNITCSNGYDKWPKPIDSDDNFTKPLKEDVLSKENLLRINNEIYETEPKDLLICGKVAYLALTGKEIKNPASMEGKELEKDLYDLIEKRFDYEFENIYYLGHTRRWPMNKEKIDPVIKRIFNN